MTSKSTVISITTENLHLVFGETDPAKRKQKLIELWHPDNEIFFVDPLGVFKTHEAILGLIEKLLAMGVGLEFSAVGEVDVLYQDEETDTWITRLKWGQGPPGGEFKITGEDVVTVVKGKIQRLYTFLDGNVPS